MKFEGVSGYEPLLLVWFQFISTALIILVAFFLIRMLFKKVNNQIQTNRELIDELKEIKKTLKEK